MENVTTAQSDQNNVIVNLEQIKATKPDNIPGALSIYRSNDNQNVPIHFAENPPKGKLIHLVPHLIGSKKNFSLKNREPKFVPFEPYKAAVSYHIYLLFQLIVN